jgi:hypothetical protein
MSGTARARDELVVAIGDVLDRLHQNDFELLIELVFSASGWKRVQILLRDGAARYDPNQDLIRIFCGAANLEDPDLLKDLPINHRWCQPWRNRTD